jgi:hypothetical protein
MVKLKLLYIQAVTMKLYEEAPCILTAVECKKVQFSLCLITATTGLEAGQATEWVWTLWSWDKSVSPAANRIPAVQPVACHYTD